MRLGRGVLLPRHSCVWGQALFYRGAQRGRGLEAQGEGRQCRSLALASPATGSLVHSSQVRSSERQSPFACICNFLGLAFKWETGDG